mmetsp:Transcript_15186/g.42520  ORF Transcript_15186/g.42520 Transcript_15186/m.42520 type:complete len:423 (+) Transcript_15186:313-1581(+)|eukprot:CAMPEP_0117653046 /NCGR_PEP_ID=MMETSP0804-20121206/2978_1 /TAXON_ID=1074897 /ORGANISM="Tetraselmis astigmatica, Strain CCMP880" /LENGTH=422 /DNA_ID=CAMNT_0005459187 /DNA_START=692 /DNA_END=1960 /DNA_ORIENTATION=-
MRLLELSLPGRNRSGGARPSSGVETSGTIRDSGEAFDRTILSRFIDDSCCATSHASLEPISDPPFLRECVSSRDSESELQEGSNDSMYWDTSDRCEDAVVESLGLNVESVADIDCRAQMAMTRLSLALPRSEQAMLDKLQARRSSLDSHGRWEWGDLDVLDFRGVNLGVNGAESLAALLAPRENHDGTFSYPKVQKLILQNTGIGVAGAAIILKAVLQPRRSILGTWSCNSSLRTLDLQDNFVGDEGIDQLASLLCDISTLPKEILNPGCRLQHLWLGGNAVGPSGSKALADAVRMRSCSGFPILSLGLGFNRVEDKGTRFLFEAMEPWWDNTTGRWQGVTCPTAITLWGNDIGDNGFQAIIQALKPRRSSDGHNPFVNCSLMSLSIFRNKASEAVKEELLKVVEEVNASRKDPCQALALMM